MTDWIERAEDYLSCVTGFSTPGDIVIQNGVEEVRALRKENEKLKQKVTRSQSDFKYACDQIESKNSELVFLRKEIERLEKEKRKADEMKEAAETAMYAYAHESDAFREKCNALEKEKAELGKELEGKEWRIGKFQRRMDDLERQKITRRDYFAGKALEGLLAGNTVRAGHAKAAVKIADALIKELDREDNDETD